MTAGRRIDPLDRAWAGLGAGLQVSGVRVPPVEAVRSAMARIVTGRPETPYGAALDPRALRWLPVPQDRLEAHLSRVVVAGPDPEPGDEAAALERLAHRHPDDLPVVVTVGPSSLGYTGSHMVGDAVTAARLVRSLVDADPGPVLRERRLDSPLLVRATLEQARRHGRDWLREGLDRRRGGPGHRYLTPAAPEAPGTCGPAAAGPTRLVGVVLSPADLSAVTRWRLRHARGTPTTAVLAALATRSLLAQGVRVDTSGLWTLVDLRRYLGTPAPGTSVGGNLAISVRLEADLLDPAALGRALSGAVASARPLPAAVLGSARAALRPPRPLAPPTGAPLCLTWNSVSGVSGTDSLPWLDGRVGRYLGAGFPVGGDGLSVVSHRMRSHLELVASVAPGTVDPQVVSRALGALADLARCELPGL